MEIAFCNYFSDIDYEPIIPPEILPAGFDAGKNNPTRRKFVVEQEGLRIYNASPFLTFPILPVPYHQGNLLLRQEFIRIYIPVNSSLQRL